MLLGVGILILFCTKTESDPVGNIAKSYEQLEVYVKYVDETQKIKLWQNEEGIFYVFLPSGEKNYSFSFGNLAEGYILRINDNFYTAQDSINEKIQYGLPYETELYSEDASNERKREQLVFMKSEEIPSLYVNTDSGGVENIHADKEVKESASVVLMEKDGTCSYADDIEYIKTRGNTSFDFEKKPYQIRFKESVSILGLPESEKWILLANEIDDSLLKNELVFCFTEEYTGVPTIRGEYVDLYINKNYVGNYYLCEKIEIAENKLNITDLEKLTKAVNHKKSYQNIELYVSEDGKIKATSGLNNPNDITGGYLVEYVPEYKYNEICTNAFKTESGNCYDIISPNPATVEQVEYICKQFNEMEQAIEQKDGINSVTGKHFSEYLDIDSWTWKYLIEEVFHDPDAALASMYFYKDSDKVDAHIFSGPMWDYDKALGYSSHAPDYRVDSPEQVGEFGIYVQELMQHEEVREKVYDKFNKYIVPYAETLFESDVYDLKKSIEMSAKMNQIRWPNVYGYYSDYDASCNYLVAFLKKKVNYLQQVWQQHEKYYTVTFLDYYGNECNRYSVKSGEYLKQVPTVTTYVAVFDGWYSVEDGHALDVRLPVLEDKTYESHWIDLGLLLENGINAVDMEISDADPELFRQLADLLEQRQAEEELNKKED